MQLEATPIMWLWLAVALLLLPAGLQAQKDCFFMAIDKYEGASEVKEICFGDDNGLDAEFEKESKSIYDGQEIFTSAQGVYSHWTTEIDINGFKGVAFLIAICVNIGSDVSTDDDKVKVCVTDNMLTKYQITLLRSVVPGRISSQSSHHCWRSPLPHASALIHRYFGCFLEVQQAKQLPHVAKVDLRASRPEKQFNLAIDEEPLDNACQVWSRIILLNYGYGQALKRSGRVISNTAPYHNTRCRTSVAAHNAAVQHFFSTVSPDSNPTTVVLQTETYLVMFSQYDVWAGSMAARTPNKPQQPGSTVTFESSGGIDKLASSTLKRHPKTEMSRADLLHLLSVLEGELQAREIVIAVLKTGSTTRWQANLALKEMTASDMRNRRHVQRLLTRIDKTWINHYTPESKQESKQWTGSGERAPKKAKTCVSQKEDGHVFWDSQGIILIDYFIAILLDRLKEELSAKCLRLAWEKVLFCQDTAPPERSNVAATKLFELGFQLVPHPFYSPDLAPCDFFLFSNIEKWLGGRKFPSNEEVIDDLFMVIIAATSSTCYLPHVELDVQAEQVKQLLYPNKQRVARGAPGRLEDPWCSLQRDVFGSALDGSFDEAAVKSLYATQLHQLQQLIVQQRRAQTRLRDQLRHAEDRYNKVVCELEEERRKHAQDTAQGDDVTYLLERERERLRAEVEAERRERQRLAEVLERDAQRHKHIILLLLAERRRLVLRLLEERQRTQDLTQVLSEEKGRIEDMVEGLEDESKKSLQMEAEMEKQLCEFEFEREQFRAQCAGLERRNAELTAEVVRLGEELGRRLVGARSTLVPVSPAPVIRPTVTPAVTPPRAVAKPPASPATAVDSPPARAPKKPTGRGTPPPVPPNKPVLLAQRAAPSPRPPVPPSWGGQAPAPCQAPFRPGPEVPRYHRLPRPKSRQDCGRQGTSKQVDHCLYRKMEQGREEDPKEPMKTDPDYESGEHTTFPKKETTLGRTQEIAPSPQDVTPPPPVSDVLGRLTTTLHQLSAVTGHRERWNRYDGSYKRRASSPTTTPKQIGPNYDTLQD
ncbi:CTTNBP2NL [Cordylochernes scorpioides]|uniref:CTTNBP2NL n=1 Tax=Cordylochernes scorpioides TaxID=51811 RepID=A0ABY6K9D8_9ARAC|nr:CTTNBP2NL [Cordylochernes scorpioides]